MALLSRIDRQPGDESPLAAVISARDGETMAMVRHAIHEKRMRLAFQPVVLGSDPSRIAFYEGLMRVVDPTGRVIPARDFIDGVEGDELGRQIDCLALDIGLTTLARHRNIRLSVNMSARSVGYPRWMRILRKGLSADQTIGERLILEVTESSAMMIPELVIAFMDELQGLGVSFALDDFGAGQTSFRYFRDFFFDVVKIDGQFIRNVSRDGDNQALTRALMSIGQHFNMMTVAESVETVQDAQWLQAAGIDCMQGYLFGAPTVRPEWMEVRGKKSG
ncbi:EAL domain, c-di-GMP-specific phosphodiesterase class I (or its enzymatically inactive variant) [Pseudorhodobacter antarcticus]|jgi:EAL domain-containing protein (putative c-di-GMP-specific phosphodiesterase class I)|uniref:EAL domain, c-di-GMP-specific phosphodiesterase class I (Or its enzymatically inactive variant) n=1 Tax=Pseudorhodobacter antarcticus TaxID=1077947 RepID=A0A1H8AD10_9RHOB|nr:EAL domain-containing protein [Pseudorhodobacter antarcticus]SEM68742.1 EAL domain, c-di-GMP-specific phosphodiesterase class I (or its enzymatically inactive variant) [Pseudorhodobacter antarcticus]